MFFLILCFYHNLIIHRKTADVCAFTVISRRGHVLLLITPFFPAEACLSITQSNILATTFRLRQKLIFSVRGLLYWIY